jgi:hypothetical protein
MHPKLADEWSSEEFHESLRIDLKILAVLDLAFGEEVEKKHRLHLRESVRLSIDGHAIVWTFNEARSQDVEDMKASFRRRSLYPYVFIRTHVVQLDALFRIDAYDLVDFHGAY